MTELVQQLLVDVDDADEELGWQERALCAQTDPESFFPEKGGSTREAKKVCLACEVRSECLEYALANDERFGIWGGLSERERHAAEEGGGLRTARFDSTRASRHRGTRRKGSERPVARGLSTGGGPSSCPADSVGARPRHPAAPHGAGVHRSPPNRGPYLDVRAQPHGSPSRPRCHT